ncbi:MAG: cadmium resistance transporter [Nostoc sp. LLA-1]|nr:cadmium resistance transporter [Cyanocohniella sp. LLY]
MNELITTLLVGISAFIATNIDDIVILLLLFSQINSIFRRRHIIAGQYLGFTILLIASLPGLFGGLIIPLNWIGLLGLVPIAMGINSLINQADDENTDVTVDSAEYSEIDATNIFNLQTYSVAVITVANGSDNISVYIPLFASSSFTDCLIIIIIFLILIAVWCYLADKFTHQTKFINFLNQKANYILPYVLIILGIIIVIKTQALSWLKLAAICICLIILVKEDKQINSEQ